VRVLFGIRHNSADAYFRAIAPASVLRYNGWGVEARVPTIEDAETFDVLVLQRYCDPVAELLMREFQDRGKPVIYDVDDWLFGIPPSWDCYGDYYHRGHARPTPTLRFHERMLRQADMVTCTTDHLRGRLLAYNRNVRVIPNCVLWADWDIVLPFGKTLDRPVVGWFGLPYHWDTWRVLADAVEAAVLEADIYLAILGFPEVVQAFSPELAERTIVQPMVPWADFHTMRRMIGSFDLGLCWLEDTAFNRCKSPLRALQFGAAGVPIVASEVVYGDVLCASTAYIAPTPDDVAACIFDTLEYPQEAQRRSQLWQNQVWEQHTYETQWHAWAKLLQEANDWEMIWS